ncbi:hypothetical protein [Mycobacteroides abscessus]|uniref:hypothetical protein n=1 Tax=Mycobacteroides abscessus TaxID=36809 RepID=UPI00266C7104|nr:hypothetical protein [Mycobacteroides abscessus]MDO2971153.1 hypothetical protein [Mycobacteroides abscessus subsp. bolletii]MDO3078537.1 hypothetical protein [Mycobacteroides abscessus subsp. bolletii]
MTTIAILLALIGPVVGLAALTYTVTVRVRDRREKQQREEDERGDAARKRLEDLIWRAASAPNFVVLKSIESVVEQEKFCDSEVELLKLLGLACSSRRLVLAAELAQTELDRGVVKVTNLQPMGRDGASIVAAANANANAEAWIASFKQALGEMQHFARTTDASVYSPQPPAETTNSDPQFRHETDQP